MRNWIRCCSLGFALLAFAWINVDTSPRTDAWDGTGIHHTNWLERLAESLWAAPLAMPAGALYGAILGATTLAVGDFVRWVRRLFHHPTG
jgi:hypothetical protein